MRRPRVASLLLAIVSTACATAPAPGPAASADLDMREAVLRSFLERSGDGLGGVEVICVSLGGGAGATPQTESFARRFRNSRFRVAPWESCSVDESLDPPRMRHGRTGRPAVGFYLGPPSFTTAGRATVRTRYFVAGDNVGDHRCSVVRSDRGWRVVDCVLSRR